MSRIVMDFVKVDTTKILLLGLFVSMTAYISYRNSRETLFEKNTFKMPFIQSAVRANCNFATSLVFVKTHKTASSTVQRMIMQMTQFDYNTQEYEAHVCPKPFFGGYPAYFDSNYLCFIQGNGPNGTKEVGNITLQNRLTRLIGHFRFNKQEVRRIMSPGTRYITIIRNPLHQFESSFWFYYRRFSRDMLYFHKHHCIGSPYIPILNQMGVNISEYIQKATALLNTSIPWYFRSRNPQSFDLGMNPLNMDEDYIKKYVEELDNTFHLVMISDYFWESVVLLKDLLCPSQWKMNPFQDYTVGHYKKHNFTEEEKKSLRNNFLKQDFYLYEHMNKSFWEKIERYGRERMRESVEELKNAWKPKDSRIRFNSKFPKTGIVFEDAPITDLDKNEKNIGNLEKRISQQCSDDSCGLSTKKIRKMTKRMVEAMGYCPY